MRYLISIYGNDEKWAGNVDDSIIAATDAHNRSLFESGELLGAFGVADQATAKQVRVVDGAPVVTDGPYIETKEYLGSIYLVDVEDEARALEIAAGMPSATFTEIEVRALEHGGTADDY